MFTFQLHGQWIFSVEGISWTITQPSGYWADGLSTGLRPEWPPGTTSGTNGKLLSCWGVTTLKVTLSKVQPENSLHYSLVLQPHKHTKKSSKEKKSCISLVNVQFCPFPVLAANERFNACQFQTTMFKETEVLHICTCAGVMLHR